MEEELLTLLQEIERRPALFLGRKSISLFAAFLDGYYYGKYGAGQRRSELLSGFQEYVVQRYKIKSDHRWNDIILFYELDEAQALKKFFDHFRKYLKLRQNEND